MAIRVLHWFGLGAAFVSFVLSVACCPISWTRTYVYMGRTTGYSYFTTSLWKSCSESGCSSWADLIPYSSTTVCMYKTNALSGRSALGLVRAAEAFSIIEILAMLLHLIVLTLWASGKLNGRCAAPLLTALLAAFCAALTVLMWLLFTVWCQMSSYAEGFALTIIAGCVVVGSTATMCLPRDVDEAAREEGAASSAPEPTPAVTTGDAVRATEVVVVHDPTDVHMGVIVQGTPLQTYAPGMTVQHPSRAAPAAFRNTFDVVVTNGEHTFRVTPHQLLVMDLKAAIKEYMMYAVPAPLILISKEGDCDTVLGDEEPLDRRFRYTYRLPPQAA